LTGQYLSDGRELFEAIMEKRDVYRPLNWCWFRTPGWTEFNRIEQSWTELNRVEQGMNGDGEYISWSKAPLKRGFCAFNPPYRVSLLRVQSHSPSAYAFTIAAVLMIWIHAIRTENHIHRKPSIGQQRK
jgi:hypothetical protein